MTILPRLLHPTLVNERISRIKVKNDKFQRALGFQKGGSNVRRNEIRAGAYDIYNDTRKVPTGVNPGAEAVTIERFPVGSVAYNIPRHAEKMPIALDLVSQLRPIGGPANTIDTGGEQYILDQETNQKRAVTNLREFQSVAMLRGSYSWTRANNGFTHSFTGGQYTIDYQMPSGNKLQLDMLGTGDIVGVSWSNAAAPIVRDLLAVNQAFEQLCGLGLTDIFCNSTIWGYVVTNTEVQNLGGTAKNPVRDFTRDLETNEFVAVLEAAPWITWHVTDVGLDIGGSYTRLIGDDQISLVCGINDAEVATYMECPEPIIDPVTNAMSMQYGEYYYHKFCDDPASYLFHSRLNGLPSLKIPASKAYATVVF